MSPSRLADAARISPYPRVNPAFEQERSLSLSANSVSASTEGSPSKARLVAEAAAAASSNRPMRTVERSATGSGRQGQGEERFNVGAPRNPKNFLRRNWRGRSSRSILDGIEEGVPNYPPPTFQEAMGIIPSPKLSTLAQSSSSTSAVLETDPCLQIRHHQSESETSIGRVSSAEVPSTSEEESLEMISPQPEDQGIEFPPCLVSSPRSLSSTDTSISPTSDSLTHGQAKSKMASILDLNDPDEDIDHGHAPEPGLVRTFTKKRFLSLSPLRTLFPPKQHQAMQARTLSAHPPGTSPYSGSRSAHFFRSTTSLASASVLRFPIFGASSLMMSGNNDRQTDDVKPIGGKSNRKLLLSMNREKEKQRLNEDGTSDNESFESWEVLGRDGEVESRRIENEPRSPIVSPSDPLSSKVISSEVSPTRSLSFTYGAPPDPITLSPIDSTPVPTHLPSTQTASSCSEPHPLSLRDRKIQETIQPFLNRQPKRHRGSRRKVKVAPSTVTVSPSVLSGAGPPVTRVRTKMNQVVNSNQTEQQQKILTVVANSVDMVAPRSQERPEDQSINAAQENAILVDMNIHEFQKALNTPLPSSPIHASSPVISSNASVLRPESLASFSSSVNIGHSSPKASRPIQDEDGVVLGNDERREVGVQPISPGPTPSLTEMADTQEETVDRVWRHHSTPYEALVTSLSNSLRNSPSPTTSSPVKIQKQFDAMPVMSSTSRTRHYQGRPLPRLPSQASQSSPSRNAVVDSIYAGHEMYPSSGRPNTSIVPEGLLIDLEHDDQDTSGVWTPPFNDHSYQMNISSVPITPKLDSPVSSLISSPDHSDRSLLPSSFADVSSFSNLPERTDLEIMAATLGEGNQNGSRGTDNETSLLISEFLGPANVAGVGNVNMEPNADTDESNMSLTGRVEVQRRRITADGRIKLKMSMFGVPLSRCGIHISQFKGDQRGSMSLSCRHIFHKSCLRQWLVRSKTCPLCRVGLDSGDC